MDLAKICQQGNDLMELGRKMKNSRFRDQDALNLHFKDDWYALPLRWNAQGLGTYATHPSPEREHLDIKSMEDPSIVHFTGPVDPKLSEVLNPYIQPPTAKPWGY
jgi:lipopolysaccharide biosynthesis glycosyltransferase